MMDEIAKQIAAEKNKFLFENSSGFVIYWGLKLKEVL